MKTVSIVTPVYKVEKFIRETVQSVIDQTYPYIEFILTDDHGGDRSIEIARVMLENVSRKGFSYKIIDYGCNKGVSVARNEAMKAAIGDYIFCLDSDDKLNPDCIEKLVSRAEETDTDVVMCGHYSDKGREMFAGYLCAPIDLIKNNKECLRAFAESWFNVAPWCKLLKTSFIKDNNLYFEPGIINEDAPWTFLMCLHANKIAFLNEKLYYYRYNEVSIMSRQKKENIIRSNDIALKIFLDEVRKRPNLWKNYDVYKIIMRQIVIFYTLCYNLFGYSMIKVYSHFIPMLKYECEFFYPSNSIVTKYYKLWNIVWCLPAFMRPLFIYSIIFIQSKK